MRILVTGAGGFIGSNRVSRLKRIEGIETDCYNLDNSEEETLVFSFKSGSGLSSCRLNRPKEKQEFYSGNYDSSPNDRDEAGGG
jgi:nucleoside-diphosphate-sugar epimerase